MNDGAPAAGKHRLSLLPVRNAVAVSLAVVLAYSVYGFFRLGDDTYIYLQYAKHLLRDGMFAFNSGEESYGFTSPLWLLLITVTVKITGNYSAAPEILSLLCTLLALLLWNRITQKQSEAAAGLGLLLMLLAAADPNLLMHSLFGMEASLSFLLSTAMLLILVEDKEQPWLLGALAGASLLTRPESAFIVSIAFLLEVPRDRNAFRYLSRSSLAFFAVVGPWAAFAWWYFGHIFPDTFAAKGASFQPFARFTLHITDTAKIFAGRYAFLFPVLLAALILRIRWNRAAYAGAAAIIVLILFYTVTLSNEFVYARYYCLVFPFFLYLIAESFSLLWSRSRFARGMLLAAVVAHIAAGMYFAAQKKEVYEDNKRAFDASVMWIKKYTSPEDAVLTGAIGRVAFETDRKIVDPLGIVNAEIIPYNRQGRTIDYLRKEKPNYFIGKDGGLIDELRPFAQALPLDSLSRNAAVSLRDKYSANQTKETLRISRLHWRQAATYPAIP